jgi:hypothetical protein
VHIQCQRAHCGKTQIRRPEHPGEAFAFFPGDIDTAVTLTQCCATSRRYLQMLDGRLRKDTLFSAPALSRRCPLRLQHIVCDLVGLLAFLFVPSCARTSRNPETWSAQTVPQQELPKKTVPQQELPKTRALDLGGGVKLEMVLHGLRGELRHLEAIWHFGPRPCKLRKGTGPFYKCQLRLALSRPSR